MHDAHDEVARGVEDGRFRWTRPPASCSKRVGKIRDEALSGYADPTQRDTMEAHLEGAEGTLQRSLTGAVVKRQQHNAAASIDDFGEQMGRAAMRDGPARRSRSTPASCATPHRRPAWTRRRRAR
jgi:hypothetical protein